jgi:phage shock protein A
VQATKMLNEEIAGLVGGLRSSSNSSLAAFRRMEQKVEELEAEADAAGQMGVCCPATNFYCSCPAKLSYCHFACVSDTILSGFVCAQLFNDALEMRFALLEGGESVDDDLLRLKTDMLADRSLPQARAYESIPNFQTKSNNVDIVWP